MIKRASFTSSVKVEKTPSCVYTLSYRHKRREAHSMSVLWKKIALREASISPKIRNYSTIQQDVQIIDKYGPYGK